MEQKKKGNLGKKGNKGNKFDEGKLRWDCLPLEEIEELVRVMTYGANKYNENPNDPNWKKVDDGYNRYFSALMRHLVASRKGEYLDPESGLPHMSHAIFNVVCLSYFAKQKYNSNGTR